MVETLSCHALSFISSPATSRVFAFASVLSTGLRQFSVGSFAPGTIGQITPASAFATSPVNRMPAVSNRMIIT